VLVDGLVCAWLAVERSGFHPPHCDGRLENCLARVVEAVVVKSPYAG
jgi:hypothetical protein